MKDSFLLYTEQKEVIDNLSNEDAGKIIKAIYEYVATGKIKGLEGPLSVIFIPFRQSIDRNEEKYQQTVEKRREAGKAGGRPKANAFLDEEEKAKKANGFSEKQTKAKKPDNDNVPVPDSDNDSEKELKDYCPEPKAAGPVITLPLNDKSEYPVYEGAVQEWAELYPAVDVIQQLRSMKGWLNANPTRRKTKSGIEKFINGWLAKEQNRSGQVRAAPKPKKEFNYEQREWDFDELEKIKRAELMKAAGTEE